MSFSLNQIPLFTKLQTSQNILIAGAGGGFDVYAGIPLYISLKSQGKNVYLANLSFTELAISKGNLLFPNCWEINAQCRELDYFPEKYLCEWLNKFYNQDNSVVFAFKRTGVLPLKKAYQNLVEKLEIDTIILVDGGTDSLLFGDEQSLGTPTEDSSSIVAVSELESIKYKYLLALGFGIDHFHGVHHYQVLENIAKLSRTHDYLGCFSLLYDSSEGQAFSSLVEYSNSRTKWYLTSIVNNSINSALKGFYGDYHATQKTESSELWINPLMSIYWAFELEGIYKNLLYKDFIKNSMTMEEIKNGIENFRNIASIKKAKNIPL
ncbi:MAG: DUF1152 domain-containing protein [Raineya sp.]|jgi:hypothetical protein|nr:DUF1152 domain-containing protein [Raineya sp.]